MAKKLALKLSVPKPCTEDWDKMTPAEKGRYCASCNKTVIDFSLFSDKQLVDYFTKAKGKICGHFNIQQTDRLIISEPYTNRPFYHKFLFGASLMAGLAGSANAQEGNKTTVSQMVQGKEEKGKEGTAIKQVIIKGVVVDSSGKSPIKDANVYLDVNNVYSISTETDSSGHFSFTIKPFELTDTYRLEAIVSGYFSELLEFTPQNIDAQSIILKTDKSLPRLSNKDVGGMVYIIDGNKVTPDTTKPPPSPELIEQIRKQHTGTPASEEGK
jgi:hypothetical protein